MFSAQKQKLVIRWDKHTRFTAKMENTNTHFKEIREAEQICTISCNTSLHLRRFHAAFLMRFGEPISTWAIWAPKFSACAPTSYFSSNIIESRVWPKGVKAEGLFSLSVKGISCTCVISHFHSKSPDLVTIIFDLSKGTVPDELQ